MTDDTQNTQPVAPRPTRTPAPGPVADVAPEVAEDSAQLTAQDVADLSNAGKAIPDGWGYSAKHGFHRVTVEAGAHAMAPQVITPVDDAE